MAASGVSLADADTFRKEFLAVLQSRRTASVPLAVHPSRANVSKPVLQREHSSISSTVRTRAEEASSTLVHEHLLLTSEAGPQGQVPLIIVRPRLARPFSKGGAADDDGQDGNRLPAVIFLHSTGRSKEMMLPVMEDYASRGYLAAAIDSRYHGDRASSGTAYSDALIEAWRTGKQSPFIYDTVWDLVRLVDYLILRQDVHPLRIGITGISLGGMHAWYAGALDPRISAVAPWIGVQSFGWAVANDKWHARVASIPHVFDEAAKSLGKERVDSEVVAAVWNRIAPGLMDKFDAPFSLPAIAPRPLLVLNGADDQRCPVPGLALALSQTRAAYAAAGKSECFEMRVYEGLGHATCADMEVTTGRFFDAAFMCAPSK